MVSTRIAKTILNEVRVNLTPEEFKEFILFINNFCPSVDEDYEIPFELGSKYEAVDKEPADAFMAAYAEYVGADMLISENRPFLPATLIYLLKICNAEHCLKLIKTAR